MKHLLARTAVALLVAAAPVGVYFAPNDEGPSYPKHWDARALDLVHYVQQERGLVFKHPVTVSFLDDAAFVEQVKEPAPTAKEKAELTQGVAEMRALGLITGNPDLFSAQNELVSKQVVGLYVPERKTLFVRGQMLTPYVRGVLAHELTHALQDQYYDLDRMQDDADDSSIVSVLIEGDAVRVEEAYKATLSQTDQVAYRQEESRRQDESEVSKEDVPQVLQDIFGYPYAFGPTYLDTLLADGGNASVDNAFRHPPVTDAQIVDPVAYPASFAPTKLADPSLPSGAKADGDVTPFGQVGELEVLGTALDYSQAWPALAGWKGDAVRSYDQGTQHCVALDVQMADGDATGRLGLAFARWVALRSGASVTSAGTTVKVRACDPGPGHGVAEVSPRPFEVLADRAEVLHLLVGTSHADFGRARCMVDKVITGLGPATFVAPDPAGTTQQHAVELLQRAAAVCP